MSDWNVGSAGFFANLKAFTRPARSWPNNAEFILLPVSDSGKWNYRAAGSVDLFREKLVRVDGAGGQTCTILPQTVFFVDLAA